MGLINVENRSPEVQDAAAKFEMGDLTNPDARQIAMAFARLAQECAYRIRGEGEKEELLAVTLRALHTARQAAIASILPAARRGQFANSLPVPQPEREAEEPEVEVKKPVRRNTRSKTTVS